ncbi:hypothetical protein DY000_02023941 [Brassica cretica]|uniref:Uncharacterized protein n=1 Tax=Brassica cretica TaxID=69181 RepID=A0ABQ7E9E0_BRACR|nr:hypothetical protein DY000_02023941 [Brassica cretica]
MKIPRNISSELPRIEPSESSSEYTEGELPRYIPRSFPTNWWSSEFPRKFVSSEFRQKFPRDFRGKMNFRRVIFEDLFRRLCMREDALGFKREQILMKQVVLHVLKRICVSSCTLKTQRDGPGCTGTSITSRLTHWRRLGNGDGTGMARKRPYDFSNNEGTVMCI